MDRRSFLKSTVAAAAVSYLPWRNGFAAEGWRTFEVTTRIDLSLPEGASRAWIPLPLVADTDWHRALDSSWKGNAVRMDIARDGKYGVTMLYAQWPARETNPVVEVTSRFSPRDRAVEVSRPVPGAPGLEPADRTFYTSPTELIPTDGIVRKTAG